MPEVTSPPFLGVSMGVLFDRISQSWRGKKGENLEGVKGDVGTQAYWTFSMLPWSGAKARRFQITSFHPNLLEISTIKFS